MHLLLIAIRTLKDLILNADDTDLRGKCIFSRLDMIVTEDAPKYIKLGNYKESLIDPDQF